MKIKNICGRSINVQGYRLMPLAEREIEKATQEIKNLVQEKYISLDK